MALLPKLTVISALSALLPLLAVAQGSFADLVDSTVVIRSDERLDSLVMRHIRVNEQRNGFDGYRVQLYSGSGTEARQVANDLRAEFLTQFPEVPAYLIYVSPNFKVRVGDLRTELEAIRLQRELSYLFPGGFVVRDVVRFPALSIDREAEQDPDVGPGDED